jgi:uncharacterized protein (TIGR01777 family)
MNVAIAGGTGMIGRHVAAALVARGDGVLVLTRDARRQRRALPARARLVEWSPRDAAGLATQLRAVDAVINLAGVPVGPRPWTPGRRRAILRSRLEATRAIVTAIGRLPGDERPLTLINASGTDTYTGLDSTPASESARAGDGFLAEVCLAWEAEAERTRAHAVRVAILRIGFVLAPGALVLRLYALPFRFRLGGPLGDGRQWMSWIHIDDLVGLVCLALDDPAVDGIFNAVSPVPARQHDVASAIGGALDTRSRLPVPAIALRLVMGEASILALGSRRVVPARALDRGYRFRWTDLRDAMADVLR